MRSSNDDITTLNWEESLYKFSLFPILRNRSQPNALLFANGINETFFTIFQQDTEVKIRCSLGLTGKQATANCDANAMNNHFVVKSSLVVFYLHAITMTSRERIKQTQSVYTQKSRHSFFLLSATIGVLDTILLSGLRHQIIQKLFCNTLLFVNISPRKSFPLVQ